jgi:surfactin synthase thioesterase subunit
MPVHVLLSGCRAPHSVETDMESTADLSDDEFTDTVARLGGLPQEVLEHPRMLARVVSLLRADYALVESYRHLHRVPNMHSPLTVFSGRQDREAPSAKVEEWARYTDRAFCHHVLDGGHFFLLEQTEPMLQRICAALQVSRQQC